MSAWLCAGRAVDGALPRERLCEAEHQELRRLLAARDAFQERLLFVEQQLKLLLLAVRDGRGMQGQVRVDPESGMIKCGEEE